MHVNTAVLNCIIPELEKYEGQNISHISLGKLSQDIKLLTNKSVNFRRVIQTAVDLAVSDFHNGKTFSINIDTTPEFRKEMEESSPARRNRFRHLFVKNDFSIGRIGLKLEAVRSDICFTINYMLEPETNRIYFVAVVGFYGSSPNGWAERVGLKETVNGHSVPSTHYMEAESARDYVYLLEKTVKFKVLK